MINVPKDAQNEIRSGMSGGDYIELPFYAPFLYWTRGEPNQSQTGSGVLHFGGWSVDAGGIDTNFDTVPPGLVKESRSGTSGVYEVYSVRYMTVATIAKRTRWEMRDEADTKGRSHNQYLCLAASFDKAQSKYVPWHLPVVLTIKGMATVYFEKVLKAWEKETLPSRKNWAASGNAAFFWMTVGTFGNRQDAQVGKTQKSYITPPQLYVPFGGDPNAWTEEQFTKLYVGDTCVNDMVDIKAAASEWLGAWKDQKSAPKPTEPEENDLPF